MVIILHLSRSINKAFNHKIIRFYITVYVTLFVNFLKGIDYLDGYLSDTLNRKWIASLLEYIPNRGAHIFESNFNSVSELLNAVANRKILELLSLHFLYNFRDKFSLRASQFDLFYGYSLTCLIFSQKNLTLTTFFYELYELNRLH
jgi:hypothetical protein